MQWSEKLSKQTALTCPKNSYKNIILEMNKKLTRDIAPNCPVRGHNYHLPSYLFSHTANFGAGRLGRGV